MVYSYIILVILNLFCIKKIKDVSKSLALITVIPVEYFDHKAVIKYLPFIILIVTLILFISLASLVVWKKTLTKYDLNKSFTRSLNLILAFIIMMNGIMMSSMYIYDSEKRCVLYLISFFFVIFLIISQDYFKNHQSHISIEFPILFFISYIAMILLIISTDVFIWFLALELMSFSFYALAGYRSKRFFLQTEGSLKYFIIGSLASSLFIFGLSLIYLTYGTVSFNNILALYYFSNLNEEFLAFLGILLILIAISFKLGIAPFHLWLPEVYYTSTSIVTFFFLLLPKLPLVYLFSQFCLLNFCYDFENYLLIIFIFTFAMGTLSSLKQTRIDKFIGYSSVANNGWFVLFLALKGGDVGFLWFYLFVSSILTILIYVPLLTLRKSDGQRLINNLRDLIVLKKTNPVLSVLYSFAFFSLAGIPPFMGFFSKFFLFLLASDQGMYSWVIISVVFSVFSSYYYIRMIKIMYFSTHLVHSYHKPMPFITAFIISLFSWLNLLFILSPKFLLLLFYFIS